MLFIYLAIFKQLKMILLHISLHYLVCCNDSPVITDWNVIAIISRLSNSKIIFLAIYFSVFATIKDICSIVDYKAIFELLSQYWPYTIGENDVYFGIYYKSGHSSTTFRVACCEGKMHDDLDKLMSDRKYQLLNFSNADLHHNTRMNFVLDHPYQIIDGPMELK